MIAARFSSVSLGLLRSIVVVFLTLVHNLNCISVLPSSVGLLALLVGHERLAVVNIIELSISETDMVPFVSSSPDGSEQVRSGHKHKLRNVENENKLHTITLVEPHPISVRLQADSLESKKLEIVRATSSPPMSVRLVFVQEATIVPLNIVIVRVGAPTRWFHSAHLLLIIKYL